MHGTNYWKEYANSGVYAEVNYIIKIKRRSSFHFIHIIFPGMIIAVLVGASFVLPPLCGERIGFCVTNVLTMVIFSLTLADQIPRSDTIPIVLSALTILFLFSVVLLIETCFILKAPIESKSGTKNSKSGVIIWFVCTLTNKYLASFLCLNISSSDKKKISGAEEPTNGNDNVTPKNHSVALLSFKETMQQNISLEIDWDNVGTDGFHEECLKAAYVWDKFFLVLYLSGIVFLFLYVCLKWYVVI